jgi:amidophosphoribosyltransferase
MELIAHNRDRKAIAKHIGAEEVIYQSLADLKAACAELSPRDPATQEFEVGVFCGKYVTPVTQGYFEHLEKVRGASRKLKVLEAAKENVIKGVANEMDIEMVTHGVAVTAGGHVVPNTNGSVVNGNSTHTRIREQEEPLTPVRDRQDIR